jgi:MFS family permease
MNDQAARNRNRVTGLLILLSAITYLDRVCISVAGPRMQQDLHIGPIGWGWVTGSFTLAYCLFEIPTGTLADRIGPRRVLTRIVLWWSAFTVLTGAMTSYYLLLLTRFFFGAGEAGAYPGASVVVSRWFPPARRATMSGVMLMAGQLGGAVAPLLVVPIQSRYGWRAPFFLFGLLGVGWATVWYTWFRDSPTEKIGPEHSEKPQAAGLHGPAGHPFPWRSALTSPGTLALLGTAFCYIYVYNFFQTWFHTFLVKGRGFSEQILFLSALPYIVAVAANLMGGALSDALVRRLGLKNGRRTLGAAALATAGLFTVAAMFTRQQILTVILLALVYGAITFQQSGVFGVCLDIGQRHAGTVVGLMNTSAQVGGLLGSVAYGYIVARFGSYDAPFVPMAALLFLGALLWLKIDASKALSAEPRAQVQGEEGSMLMSSPPLTNIWRR